MEEIENLKLKITKLLRLSENNPNKAEAISAALKAKELMIKYKISSKEILKNEEIEINQIKIKLEKWKSWQIELSGIVAVFYKCISSYSTVNKNITFYGEKNDLIVAEEIFKFLFNIGDYLAMKEYRKAKKEGYSKGVYKSFIVGFLLGVEEALTVQEESMEEQGLVITTHPKVRAFVKNLGLKESKKEDFFKKDKNLNIEIARVGYIKGKESLKQKQISTNEGV